MLRPSPTWARKDFGSNDGRRLVAMTRCPAARLVLPVVAYFRTYLTTTRQKIRREKIAERRIWRLLLKTGCRSAQCCERSNAAKPDCILGSYGPALRSRQGVPYDPGRAFA